MVEPAAHLDCVVQPIAPRSQTHTPCDCTKRHDIQSRTRGKDTVKGHSEQELEAAAAGITGCTVFQQSCIF